MRILKAIVGVVSLLFGVFLWVMAAQWAFWLQPYQKEAMELFKYTPALPIFFFLSSGAMVLILAVMLLREAFFPEMQVIIARGPRMGAEQSDLEDALLRKALEEARTGGTKPRNQRPN